jgi:hypothetical protein
VWLEQYLSQYKKCLVLVSHSQVGGGGEWGGGRQGEAEPAGVAGPLCAAQPRRRCGQKLARPGCARRRIEARAPLNTPPPKPRPQDFLNGVCTHIIWLTRNTLTYYSGNYDTFRKTVGPGRGALKYFGSSGELGVRAGLGGRAPGPSPGGGGGGGGGGFSASSG